MPLSQPTILHAKSSTLATSLAALLAASLFVSSPALSQTFTWTGNGDGTDWEQGANWDTDDEEADVPYDGVSVEIGDGTPTLSTDASVADTALSGGTFTIDGSGTFSAGGPFSITGGTLSLDGGSANAYEGLTLDDGEVVIANSGALTVSGQRGFRMNGGTVTVEQGTLEVDARGGAMISDGLLTVDGGAFNVSRGLSLQGGEIVVKGGGTLDDTGGGLSVYGGNLRIEDGTVSANGGFSIDGGEVLIDAGGELNDNAGGYIYDGLLEIANGGILNTADFYILGGTIDVKGRVEAGGGYLYLGDSYGEGYGIAAQLQGTGAIGGSIYADDYAVISPGGDGAIGTLTVENDVYFNTGSTYAVDVGANGVSDLLDVWGDVYIDGGQLSIAAMDGISYQEGWEYTVLTANSVNGQFINPTLVVGDFAQFAVDYSDSSAVKVSISGFAAPVPPATIEGAWSPGGQGVIATDTYSFGDDTSGNLIFTAGSTYLVDVGVNGVSDKVVAEGTITIEDGAKVAFSPMEGVNYARGWQYSILESGGLTTGTFDAPIVNGDFASFSLSYAARSVTARIDQIARVDFTTRAETPNQTAVAGAFGSVPQDTVLYNALYLGTAGSTGGSLDQLSGDLHPSTVSALVQQSHQLADAVNARLGATLDRPQDTSSSPLLAYGPLLEGLDIFSGFDNPDPAGPVVWASGLGRMGSIEDANAGSFATSGGGILFGLDHEVAEGLLVGAVAGYNKLSVETDGGGAAADSYLVGAYAGGRWDGLGLRAGAAYSWHNLTSERAVDIALITNASFTDALSAAYNGDTIQAFGELSYRFDAGFAAFEPYAGLAHARLRTTGFTEDGGVAALDVAEGVLDATFATLGVRASADLALGETVATLSGNLGWRRGLNGTVPQSTAAFANSDAFTVAGVAVPQDVVLVGAGLDLRLGEAGTLGLSWNGQFGSGLVENSLGAHFNVKF